MPTKKLPLAANLAVGAFGALSLLGGWMIVYGGEFQHTAGRTNPSITIVAGAPALFMAALQFLAAALALTALLRQWQGSTVSAGVAFGLVMVPPLLFLWFAP